MIAGRTPTRRSKAYAGARGFTLVEMMAVVAMVGILSAVAIYSVRKYILASKTAEVTEMLGAIKTAQEQYRAETFFYKDVSGVNALADYSTFYPSSTVLKRSKMAWGDGTTAVPMAWRELGVQPTGPVLYIYGCAAGPGSMAPAAPGITIANYPAAADGKPWYLAKAAGDLDGDGTVGTWVTISATPEIFHDKQEE